MNTATTTAVQEPLAESAPLARQWATRYCAEGADGVCCDYYHGLWQYLRLMGLGPTLGGHAGLYLQGMADLAERWRVARGTPRRVLISGCADYAMLAHVLHAFAGLPARPQITVLDICQTPLELNAWYAGRLGQPVELVCEDLLRHGREDHYDLVITSSFLGYFSPAQRPRMFGAYTTMLRGGGRLIFSNRIRPGREDITTGFVPDQVALFADRVALLCRDLPPDSRLSEDDARRMASAYAGLRRPYPVRSVDSVRQLAQDAGLAWVEHTCVSSGKPQGGVHGPTLADGSNYLFVVLEKPEHGIDAA